MKDWRELVSFNSREVLFVFPLIESQSARWRDRRLEAPRQTASRWTSLGARKKRIEENLSTRSRLPCLLARKGSLEARCIRWHPCYSKTLPQCCRDDSILCSKMGWGFITCVFGLYVYVCIIFWNDTLPVVGRQCLKCCLFEVSVERECLRDWEVAH